MLFKFIDDLVENRDYQETAIEYKINFNLNSL